MNLAKNYEGAVAEVRSSGLQLVRRPPVAVSGAATIREGSTGAVVTMLPRVWAVAEQTAQMPMTAAPASRPKVEVAFYRKYTEAMLRRYLRLSTEAGRVPSLLGREMFRGNVTSYRVHSFEDVVVFCMDVERCLARLNASDKEMVRRMALQQYTQQEAAAVMGVTLKHVARGYAQAMDRLTTMLLESGLLEPLKSCQ